VSNKWQIDEMTKLRTITGGARNE